MSIVMTEAGGSTIELGDENAEAFREVLAPYIEAGHRVTGSKKPAHTTAPRTTSGDTKAVRECPRANGYDITNRGRIPADVAEAYTAARYFSDRNTWRRMAGAVSALKLAATVFDEVNRRKMGFPWSGLRVKWPGRTA